MNIPSPTTPPVISHRGARGHAPENTLASIRRAAALGALWVEFDTKLTADGHIIVLHDNTVERTTDGAGAVAEMNLAAFDGLDAGSWFGDEFAGEPVPTLKQALVLLDDLGLAANVEIKATPGTETESGRVVARFLDAHWPATLPPPLVSSFSHRTLAAVGDAAPQFERALLVLEFPDDWRARLAAEDCRALHALHRHLTEERVRAVTEAGFHLRCFTVNERARAEVLWAWGVEAVITDFPERQL